MSHAHRPSSLRVPLRVRALLLVSVLLLLSLPVASTAQDTVGPDTYPDGINPLTGLPVEDTDLLDRRPLLIKVSNYPPLVRPQRGLNEADVVWEYLLAGGVTRFAAVFLSQDPARVGPIRSGRLTDFELTRIYRSFFVYSGMAQGTIEILRQDGLVSSRAMSGIEPCPALCRYPEEGLALEHTLYGSPVDLRALAVELDRDVDPEPVYGMAFNESLPEGGTPLDAVDIAYRQTTASWTYDAESASWLRSTDGQPHFTRVNTDDPDLTTEARISAANVLIVEEEHTVQPFVSENYWGPANFAYSTNFIGEGRAFLLRDGVMIEGLWQRETRQDPLRYVTLDGAVLPFKPGNTFVALVPEWVDGYQLVFHLSDAPQVSTAGSVGVLLRTGPGESYISPDVTYPGDTFDAVGRNRAGDWLQVRRADIGAAWLPLAALDVGDLDADALPISRPIVER